MLKDCIELFQENLEKQSEEYVIHQHIPKDGTYLLIKKTQQGFESGIPFDIRYEKKKKTLLGSENSQFSLVQYLDYYSKLIEMNKPIDSSKVIHSNNFLSYAVKKDSIREGKLKKSTIEGYNQMLRDPRQKYKKPKAKALYNEAEQDLGAVDEALLNEIESWVLEHIFSLDNIALEKKDYLKLFFVLEDEEETKAIYRRESKRYLLPNIYNNNDFNQVADGRIYGLPNDNMGMNSKKPYLANRSRGNAELPYLLNQQDVLKQSRFFDYLMGMASAGKYDVYFDTRERLILGLKAGEAVDHAVTGYYMRLKKEKNEVAILRFETVARHNPNMDTPFQYKAFFKSEEEASGKSISKRGKLEEQIDTIFFNNCLRTNYFTEPGDLLIKDGVLRNNLLLARDRLHSWFHTKDGADIRGILERVSKELICDAVNKGYYKKAKRQMNLRWSLRDYLTQSNEREEFMDNMEAALRHYVFTESGDWDFSDDDEYYFAVGQLMTYFIHKSRGAKKTFSLANGLLNTRKNDRIKKELDRLFKKYNYDIYESEYRIRRLLSRVQRYETESPANHDMIIAGLLADNVLLEKLDIAKEKLKKEGGL